MEQLRILAANAATELRLSPPAHVELPHTRAFADALNAEVSKPGRFDPKPWIRVEQAFYEHFDERDLHLLLWYLAGLVSLLVVQGQHQVKESSLVADVLRLCDAIATPTMA